MNTPLTRFDKIKVTLFLVALTTVIVSLIVGSLVRFIDSDGGLSLLLLLFIYYFLLFLPHFFIFAGIYRMKKERDFSLLQRGVNACKGLLAIFFVYILLGIGSLLLADIRGWIIPNFEEELIQYIKLLSGAAIGWLLLSYLFYNPLKNHSEWIAQKGIFASKSTL